MQVVVASPAEEEEEEEERKRVGCSDPLTFSLADLLGVLSVEIAWRFSARINVGLFTSRHLVSQCWNHRLYIASLSYIPLGGPHGDKSH